MRDADSLFETNHRGGFTLVELSIVLVIIGLLVGGILAAESMISTTRVQSFTRKVQQFDAAVNNFATSYRGVPGDSSLTGCVVAGTNTCDNQILEDDKSNNMAYPNLAYVDSFSAEVGDFWVALAQTGFAAPAVFSNTITTKFAINGTTLNSPSMPVGKNTGVIAYFESGSGYFGASSNYYAFGDYSKVTANATHIFPPGLGKQGRPSIDASSALAIDNKLDDGISTSGNVTDNAGCTNGATYDVENSTQKCWLYIKMSGSSN